MYGLYIAIVIFQIFCIYHAYKAHVEQRWFWLILFFPLGGSIIYLIYNLGDKGNLDKITETVKVVVNSNHNIEKLELALDHSDNVTNRVNLADEFVNVGRYDEAISLYEKCLLGFLAGDPGLKMKLIHVYFMKNDYAAILPLAKELEHEKEFHNSEERSDYAWALHRSGNTTEARKIFDLLDKPYTNYNQRLEFCRYLNEIGEKELSKDKLNEMTSEFRFMKAPERKIHRNIIRAVEDFQFTLSRPAV
jgi:hypothetical protein